MMALKDTHAHMVTDLDHPVSVSFLDGVAPAFTFLWIKSMLEGAFKIKQVTLDTEVYTVVIYVTLLRCYVCDTSLYCGNYV